MLEQKFKCMLTGVSWSPYAPPGLRYYDAYTQLCMNTRHWNHHCSRGTHWIRYYGHRYYCQTWQWMSGSQCMRAEQPSQPKSSPVFHFLLATLKNWNIGLRMRIVWWVSFNIVLYRSIMLNDTRRCMPASNYAQPSPYMTNVSQPATNKPLVSLDHVHAHSE